MKKIFLTFITLSAVLICTLAACKKENDFLNAKPNQALAIPSTLNDLSLLLNDESLFNRNYPSLQEAGTDDILMDASVWLSDLVSDKNAYVWAPTVYAASDVHINDWNFPYQIVYYSNTVLNVLPTIKISNDQQAQANSIKGSALFFRGMAFYNIASIFAMQFDSTSATKDLGIIIPLKPDITLKLGRSTIAQSYNQIIGDLSGAVQFLPDLPTTKTTPSKAAAYGLLSRVYLNMGHYSQSLVYANKCLALYNRLEDFNTISKTAFPVFRQFSSEELFHAGLSGYKSIGFTIHPDSNLYKLYNDPNDLRLTIFFRINAGKLVFRSAYDVHNNATFSISTSEMMLNKAECEARTANITSAMNDLNALLITRWKAGTYQTLKATTADEALRIILLERRKELVLTTIRWTDLRRLNKDPKTAITLYRSVNGVSYTLPPNDPKYTLPIPYNELQLNPVPQNIR